MSSEKKYIITRSNYTVKKKHKRLDTERTVYERDFMITNSNDTWSGNGGPYGTSSFKMVTNIKENGRYKYNNGEWLKQYVCNDNNEIWTYKCLPNKDVKNSENNITIIPNYNSLLDFAYYGSTKDLIKTSMEDIISNFPAELYFSDNKHFIGDEEYVYLIENPFDINIHTNVYNKVENKDLRLFSQSFDNYEFLMGSKRMCVSSWQLLVDYEVRLSCAEENDILYTIRLIDSGNNLYDIDCYYIDGKMVYTFSEEEMIGLRIRPIQPIIDKFFNELDIFQKVILNRNTIPFYTMHLEYPHETEKGIETYKKRFTWPTLHEWNLDIRSSSYNQYFNSLMELCDYYDNRKTNNLWRVMTHDSLKNMDYAFKNDKIDESDYEDGESRFEYLIKCCAKQFDDIKRFIDNIKTTNNLTYNGNCNTPNYFLSDKLEMSGWEPYNLASSLNETSVVNGKDLFSNVNRKYNVSDANVELLKNLQINSKEILSRKGTRHGIEMLLGLFGLTSYDINKTDYDYKITEYVDTVVGDAKMNVDDVFYFNENKMTFTETFIDADTPNTDPLQNLPLRLVEYNEPNGNLNQYIIPWFDKNQNVDGNPYYQMFGGWCKTFKKDLNNSQNISDDFITTNTIKGYDETIKNLILVKNISDLRTINDKIYDGCIVYVTYIYDFDDVYNNDENNIITLNGDGETKKASHYFILENVKNSYVIGSYTKQDNTVDYGWENITDEEINSSSQYPNNDRGLKVRLIENVIENHKGNNPHGGYGRYDDGETFLDYFRQVFKFSIENDNFNDALYDCEDGSLNEKIGDIGFDIERQKDNVKTWYFTNTYNDNENKLYELTKKINIYNSATVFRGEVYNDCKVQVHSYTKKEMENVNVGSKNEETFFESETTPYDFEKIGVMNDESNANSIINNKKMLIEFSGGIVTNKAFPLFLQEGILPYLKQMIPSTTILEIDIEGGYAEYAKLPYAESNIEEENKIEITE